MKSADGPRQAVWLRATRLESRALLIKPRLTSLLLEGGNRSDVATWRNARSLASPAIAPRVGKGTPATVKPVRPMRGIAPRGCWFTMCGGCNGRQRTSKKITARPDQSEQSTQSHIRAEMRPFAAVFAVAPGRRYAAAVRRQASLMFEKCLALHFTMQGASDHGRRNADRNGATRTHWLRCGLGKLCRSAAGLTARSMQKRAWTPSTHAENTNGTD